MSKIYDCITFFNENFISNLRFEILNEVVDYFIICESIYDHQSNKKKLNFILENKDYRSKIIHLVLDKPFKPENNPWQNQALQREHILTSLDNAQPNDLIMFSDPDEIPNPQMIKNIKLSKKYGIFLQEMYCYKFNLYNQYESPWEGTRICKKKNLKSVDYMRQKVQIKNLKKPFWKFYYEKDIEVYDNGGWHFNSILTPEEISMKLKTFAHTEYSGPEYSDPKIIKKNIEEKVDLFKRGRHYKKASLDKSFPQYILNNKLLFKKWIL